MNKVVARFVDGKMVKGITADFFPGKDIFHVSGADASAEAKPVQITTKGMKALFFVKDFAGDPKHVKKNEFDPSLPTIGRRIRVKFRDGEVLVGTTTGYQPGRAGFFVVPADMASNNERCYVISLATQEINFI